MQARASTSCQRRARFASARGPSRRSLPDLQDRRVEITGPVDRKMIINALNSGAKVFMADFEDANSPTWEQPVEGQINLRDAVRRTISLRQPGRQGVSAQRDRPRRCWCGRAAGICPRSTCSSMASPISGSLFDFGLYFFHNAEALLARGTGPYFYLPKMESHLEARLWNDVFVHAQEQLGMPQRHDQGHGADRDDPRRLRDGRDPLRAARPLGGPQLRALGLHLQLHQEVPQTDPEFVLPDRAQVTMTTHFMRSYSLL